MSDQPPRDSSRPPPLPAAPLQYAAPPSGYELPPASKAQRVFDTVAGPNVRLLDNLVQLGCVVEGGGVGVVVGLLIRKTPGDPFPLVAGGLIGVIAALAVSGVVIGIVRGFGIGRR
ncbi:hypothetical protein [Humisphaera borealis]|uniref:Uncharacterized protein n=1 Tax=Humisphaera borealis TaxID=2807512 RepID=A0A7M2WW03_9BACT|nr:hypothetical protein [Humisphaera borealis]QOV89593.1 hypothetical protein IPV69_25955 [Humisphaera borealis]